MGDKDPPPFGYTFSHDFFGSTPSTFDASGPGQSLLNDMENQSLADFFTNTDPFHLDNINSLPAVLDNKDAVFDFDHWSDFVGPATVHRVTTTIPDQAHLQQNSLYHEPTFATGLHTDHLGNTQDDLQAASTLFNTTQPSYINGSSQAYHRSSIPTVNTNMNSATGSSHNPRPMVITPHGLIHEQLAALLPNHTDDGTLDAQLAAHWAANNASDRIEQHMQQHEAGHSPLFQKTDYKRSYTFGTDSSFNSPVGFSAPSGHGHGDASTQHQARVEHSDLIVRSIIGAQEPTISPTEPRHAPHTRANDLSDAEKSENGSSEDESGERQAKKRRTCKSRAGKDSPRKTTRNAKIRKTSLAEESSRKRRVSTAAQKLQRENLTEEQKRSNHILSEQKRRNLIKQGFGDLHDLVPEIRNGGLSKSSVLTEAGNFLDALVQENNAFWRVAGGAPGANLG